MAHSSTPGTPKIESAPSTMTGVPTPGGNHEYKPKEMGTSGSHMKHGEFPEGGNQKVMPKTGMGTGTKGEWSEPGGNQKVMPK